LFDPICSFELVRLGETNPTGGMGADFDIAFSHKTLIDANDGVGTNPKVAANVTDDRREASRLDEEDDES